MIGINWYQIVKHVSHTLFKEAAEQSPVVEVSIYQIIIKSASHIIAQLFMRDDLFWNMSCLPKQFVLYVHNRAFFLMAGSFLA